MIRDDPGPPAPGASPTTYFLSQDSLPTLIGATRHRLGRLRALRGAPQSALQLLVRAALDGLRVLQPLDELHLLLLHLADQRLRGGEKIRMILITHHAAVVRENVV